ncbi:carbohydrate binding domain-containing protein, partial [Flavobacterium succinicans]
MKTKLLLLFLFLTITLQAQTNLVPNGDFENWTSSSQPDKWFRSFSGLVFQSTSAQNGSSSTKMQITSGTLNFINSEFFPVVAGKTYRIRMYHKLVTGTFSTIELSLYHQPGTFKEEIAKKTTAVTSSTEWRKLEFDYTPTVSESIEVDIWTTGTLNSEILVDNVSVVDVAEPVQQYTIIPDVNFEKKLIALGHDSGIPDGKVLTDKINKVTNLYMPLSNISDLTGIQDFVGLKSLNCSNNQLTNLDVTKNVALTELICSSNKLTNLNLSNNLALINLYCSYNQLTNLDITKNVALKKLSCEVNQLTSLDLTKNFAITDLSCRSNKLTSLDLLSNTALVKLDCEFNSLTNIDLSKNIALEYLFCETNALTILDVSKNIALKNLDFDNNNIKELNLSNNKELTNLSGNR